MAFGTTFSDGYPRMPIVIDTVLERRESGGHSV